MSEEIKPTATAPAVASSDLVRPVRCWFCNQPMYYAGDPRHESEVRVEVYENQYRLTEFYSHVRCWSDAIYPTGSASDVATVLDEHREMCFLLMQAVDAMRVTQRLFDLTDGHMLMSKCREIERWLDAHQAPNEKDQR